MLKVVSTLFTAKSAADFRPDMQVSQLAAKVSLVARAVAMPAVRLATTATTAPMGFAAMTAFRATCATVSVLAPLAAARWAAFRAVVAREYAAVAVVARAVAAL